MYFGTEDRSEKSVRAQAGRVSRTWGKHDQSGANFEAWSRITSNVERSWKTRLKNASGAKASGAIKSTAAGFMDIRRSDGKFRMLRRTKTKGVEEMKRRTPLMFRSRIARPAVEDLKIRQWSSAARHPGFECHAKSAVMFRTGSDGKKSSGRVDCRPCEDQV